MLNFARRKKKFVELVKKQEAKRVQYDRFRVVIVLTLVVIIGCSAVCVGFAGKNVVIEREFRSKSDVGFYISNILLALVRETTYSVAYVSSPNTTFSDYELGSELAMYQQATQQAVAIASINSNGCSLCTSIVSMINVEVLLFVQSEVMRRSLTPLECLQKYQSLFEATIESLSFFVGYALTDTAVNALWLQDLVSAVQAVGMLAPACMDGNLYTPDLADQMYSEVSRSVAQLNSISRESFLLNTSVPQRADSYASAVSEVLESTDEVFENINVSLDGITVVSDVYSPEEALEEINETYTYLLDSLQKGKNSKDSSMVLNILTLTTNVIVVFLALIGIVIILYAALSIIWVSSEYRYNLRHEERFKSSLERMEFFVDNVYDLDMEGVVLATQRSASSKSITSAERDLLRLAPKVIQVLAFINPNVYSFRKNFIRNEKKSINVFFSDESKEVDDVAIVPETYKFGDKVGEDSEYAGMDPCVDASPQPQNTNPLADSLVSTVHQAKTSKHFTSAATKECDEACITGLPETKLVMQSVCFLLADISALYDEITSETSKTRPLEISFIISQIMQAAKNGGGEYITTAGALVILAFNDADVLDAENTTAMVLLTIQQKLLSTYSSIRFAIISGVVPQGIVGSPSLKSYITDGTLLYTAEMLLQIARLHDATAVVDPSTFTKIDTQYFSKRALEQVGMDDRDLEDIITVYEIVPQTNDKGSFMWNEAFDQFHAGEFEKAREKLKAWKKKYGATKSWSRMHSLLHAYPRPRTVTFLYCSGNNLEPELLLT